MAYQGTCEKIKRVICCDSFENTVVHTRSPTYSFTFSAREYDPESGLFYYRARYYDPKVGRFLQPDPLDMAMVILIRQYFPGSLNGRLFYQYSLKSPMSMSNMFLYVVNNPIIFNDPLGLRGFQLFDQTIDIGLSVSFLPINIAWDLGGISLSNLSFNAIFPPLTVGGGVDISINPPSPCEKYISPYLGLGRNLSFGTNISVISKGKEPLKLKVQGFNLNLGPSLGIPIGALIPNAFSNKQRQLGDMGIKYN